MTLSLLLRVVLTWLLFLPIPIINGILREKWYSKILGDNLAHQIGVPILAIIFLLYAFISLKGTVATLSTAQLWFIGIIWLVLTLVFEFGIGLAGGRTWSFMLSEYKIWEGKFWPVVPLVTLLSPHIIKWFVK